MHDYLYALGFDEASGNFQVDNFRPRWLRQRSGLGGGRRRLHDRECQ